MGDKRTMDPFVIGIIGLVACLLLMAFSVPIAVATGVVGFIGYFILFGIDGIMLAASSLPFYNTASFDWCVVPMFTLVGLLLFNCGLGDKMFTALNNWLGWIPGGLAMSVSLASAALGTIDASGIGTAVIMGKVAYPEMTKQNYSKSLSFATIATGGTLGIIIPPSVILSIYAVLAEVSVGECLIAGIIPGIVLSVLFCLMIFVRVKINPSLAPGRVHSSWKEKIFGLRYVLPILIMFIIICGGIYLGIFTATEAGGVAAVVAIILCLVTKRLTWKIFVDCMRETVRLSAMILAFMAGISIFTKFLNITGITLAFANWATSFSVPIVTILLMIAVYYLFGMFIGATGMLMITVPIFAPVVEALGYSPIWFGVLATIMCAVALISPPVAAGVFIAHGAIKADIPLATAYKSILPFWLVETSFIVLLLLFPQMATWLPSLMM